MSGQAPYGYQLEPTVVEGIRRFSNEKNITIENAHNNSKYNVIINNLSTSSLKYIIEINSYIKR